MPYVLILVVCMGGRYCVEEPQYVVQFQSEKSCLQEKALKDKKQRDIKLYCVPLIGKESI